MYVGSNKLKPAKTVLHLRLMIKETFRRSVLHTADFTLQTINCTLVNAHCILHCTVLYTLHTVLYYFGLFYMSDLHISYILTW